MDDWINQKKLEKGEVPDGGLPAAEFKEKLDRVRSLLSGRFPRGASLEEIFGAALEVLLDKVRSTRQTVSL